MDDDLDTPGAIACLYNFVTNANKFISSSSLSSKTAQKMLELIQTWGGNILGILPEAKKDSDGLDLGPVMDIIMELRKDMKAAKKYDVADAIRDRLKDGGILIEDTKEGTRWRKA
jgi:cysteinyl-tRNA synthetase